MSSVSRGKGDQFVSQSVTFGVKRRGPRFIWLDLPGCRTTWYPCVLFVWQDFSCFFDDETAPFKFRVEDTAFRDRAGKKVRLKFQMFVLDCSVFEIHMFRSGVGEPIGSLFIDGTARNLESNGPSPVSFGWNLHDFQSSL